MPAQPVGRPVGILARYVVFGAAVGVPVGSLWVVLAPRVPLATTDPVAFVEPYPQGFAVADLVLGALLLAAGVLLGGVASRRLVRTGFHRGWVHVAGVIAAAGTTAAVARVIGWWAGGRRLGELPDGTLQAPLTVGATGVMLLGAFSALLAVLFAAVLSPERQAQ